MHRHGSYQRYQKPKGGVIDFTVRHLSIVVRMHRDICEGDALGWRFSCHDRPWRELARVGASSAPLAVLLYGSLPRSNRVDATVWHNATYTVLAQRVTRGGRCHDIRHTR